MYRSWERGSSDPELEPLRGGPGVSGPRWVSLSRRVKATHPREAAGRCGRTAQAQWNASETSNLSSWCCVPKTSGLGTLLPFNQDFRACAD